MKHALGVATPPVPGDAGTPGGEGAGGRKRPRVAQGHYTPHAPPPPARGALHVAAAPVDPRATNAALLVAAGASGVLDIFGALGAGFNGVNCATALARVARGAPQPTDARVRALLRRSLEVLGGGGSGAPANARTLTSVAHSMGLLGRAAAGGVATEGDGDGGGDDGAGAPPCGAGDATTELLRRVLAEVVAAVAGVPRHDPAAPGAAATALWALGVLRCGDVCDGVGGVCDAAAALADRMSPAEVANAAWGAARARLRAPALMAALARAAAAAADADALSAQGLASVAGAWAKLRLRSEPLAGALAAAAVRMLAKPRAPVDGAALATLLWAFSREPCAALTAAVLDALRRPGVLGALPPHAVASLLQSLGPGCAEGEAGDAEGEGGSRGMRNRIDGGADVLAAVGAAAVARLPAMGASEVGLLAAAVVRGAVRAQRGDAGRLGAALASRVAAVAPGMDWRGVAAAELALRMLAATEAMGECISVWSATEAMGECVGERDDGAPQPPPLDCAAAATGAAGEALAALTRRAIAAADALAATSDAAAAAPSAALAACLARGALPPVAVGGRPAPRVLLIGDDPSGAARAALHARGWRRVTHWRRFACDRGGGSRVAAAAPAPPPRAGRRLYDAVVARVAPSADAASLVAAAAAAALPPGAPLLLYGAAAEGAAGACGTEGLFGGLAPLLTDARGSVVVRAHRLGGVAPPAPVAAPSAAAGGRVVLELPRVGGRPAAAARVLWAAPRAGLFAGGGVDVMSAALLGALPPPPRRLRAIDFGCGSGVLAAALLAAAPDARVSMCDADAVALGAARVNVPHARHVVLADGWAAAGEGVRGGGCDDDAWRTRRFDWILSNPPVHRGVPDDLRVLTGLLGGARARLRPHGDLWIVTQAQVRRLRARDAPIT